MKRIAAALMVTLLLAQAAWAQQPQRPRLVVLLVIDQFRADYLTLYEDLFLPPVAADGSPGGFRWLMEKGACFQDCRYDQIPTVTAVGHSVISSGAFPYKSGIVSNEWLEPGEDRPHVSVYDPTSPLMGVNAPPDQGRSAARLRVTAFADELRMANNGLSQVVSVSMKDRASILLGGHMPTISIWMDKPTATWVSSKKQNSYTQLPRWVELLSEEPILKERSGTTWEKLLPEAAYKRVRREGMAYAGEGVGLVWPHVVKGGAGVKTSDYVEAIIDTPAGLDLTLKAAEAAIPGEGLGQDEYTDLLGINLATNDYVGHTFGPYSPEVLDITVRTDRRLAQFLKVLDARVGLENVVFVLSADHGAAAIPEQWQENRIPASRITEKDVVGAIDGALGRHWGTDHYVRGVVEPFVYLDPQALSRHQAAPAKARRAAAAALRMLPSIENAWTREDVLEGRLPRTEEARLATHGFHPVRSGDIVVTLAPQAVVSWEKPSGTTHETHWTYDTRVPLLMAGPGIRAGRYAKRATPNDISITLSTLLGIGWPSGAEGRVLGEALVDGK